MSDVKDMLGVPLAIGDTVAWTDRSHKQRGFLHVGHVMQFHPAGFGLVRVVSVNKPYLHEIWRTAHTELVKTEGAA